MWAEGLPGTTYGQGPLLQSIVCRDHTRTADGVSRALAAIVYVTGTTLQDGFDILRMDEVSTICSTACSSTYVSSRFIFWYSGISQTPGQSFSLKKDGSETRFLSGTKAFFTVWCAKNLKDLKKLIPLEWNILFRIQLCLFALEYWSQTCKFCENAADRPAINRLIIMLCTHEQLGSTVPYCDNNFVTCKQGL